MSSYTYDGDGVRVSAIDGGVTTDCVWDRTSGLELLISDGTTGYTYGNGGLVAQTGATTDYLLDDGLGSIREITDAAGASTGTADFAAFGDPRAVSGAGSAFGFAGQQSDPTGLQYLRARCYDPTTGTFLSTDPVTPGAGGVVGYNPYSYVANNPTTWTDPSGQTILAERGLQHSQQTVVVAPAARATGITIEKILSDLLVVCFALTDICGIHQGSLYALIPIFVPGSTTFWRCDT